MIWCDGWNLSKIYMFIFLRSWHLNKWSPEWECEVQALNVRAQTRCMDVQKDHRKEFEGLCIHAEAWEHKGMKEVIKGTT